MNILVTGAAGFIGYHLSVELLEKGCQVTGIDNLNDYYDVNLKHARLKQLLQYGNFSFYKADLNDKERLDNLFEKYRFEYVVNLAAQAGVRYSVINPYAYVDSNIAGFINILEACRKYPVKHLVFASSSSVYGGNKTIPFSVNHNTDHPVSLYAATKKSNELMAHVYSYLYKIPVTGLRFFTVYGPWGRPDMSYYIFAENLMNNRPITLFNHGNIERDFTYISDVTECIIRVIHRIPEPDPAWDEKEGDISRSFAPYKLYNVGNNRPVKLERIIGILEEKTGRRAIIEYADMQPGDVCLTCADTDDLEKDISYKPVVSIEEGFEKFVDWFLNFKV